ncbi:MAG TPA: GNAT family N-acetyltransferase [Thermoanaerobaculia bacterium]|nr:GNAT family N-acetyltransferase [Thermoanaerobaculia bacterium]
MNVEAVDLLSEQDRQQLLGWATDPFGTAALHLEWRPKLWHLIHRQDGLAVAKVSVLRHTIVVGDRELEVGGLGGVVTRPEYQRRGYARQLLERASNFMRGELGLDHALLFCLDRMRPFYEELGWKPIRAPVSFLNKNQEIDIPTGLNAMSIDFGEARWPEGTIQLRSLPW